MTLPSARDWLFSGKAFAAAMLALYLAFAFDLPSPYWAMTTVYVVMNPLSGATASKALYRALGTLLGASAAVAMVPPLANAPELLCLAVALWAGTLMYGAMLDRTPRGYIFMLAAYTLPLIALPTVTAPETIFDVAIARSEEIILGILCASIVAAIVFPVSIGPVLAARAKAWLGDAGAWAAEILRGGGAAPATPAARQRLAADIAALDAMIAQFSYDAGARDVERQAKELRGGLLLLPPLLSSLADRLHAMTLETGALPADLSTLTTAIADWIASGSDPEAADRFADAIAALEPAPDAAADWHGLVLSSFLARLAEVVALWRDCLMRQQQIAAGRPEPGWRPASRFRPVIGGGRHHDHLLMLFSAGSAAAATLAAGLIWIHSGWAGGANFMAMTTVACCFFGALDRPAPQMRAMAVWTSVALLAAGTYLLAVLPGIEDFAVLIAVLAVYFLPVGALIPRPQIFLPTMMLAVNGAAMMSLQDRFSTDFASFANEGLAVVGGQLFAMLWTLVTKPFGAGIAARRLIHAGWAELAAMAEGAIRRDHGALANRALDRLGQLAPRLAASDATTTVAGDALAELRIGYNLLDLRRDRAVLSDSTRRRVDAVLAAVAAHFRSRKAGTTVAAPETLRAAIDRALDAVAGQAGTPAHVTARAPERDAAHALVGLRRGLFPHAPGPRITPAFRTPLHRAAQVAAE